MHRRIDSTQRRDTTSPAAPSSSLLAPFAATFFRPNGPKLKNTRPASDNDQPQTPATPSYLRTDCNLFGPDKPKKSLDYWRVITSVVAAMLTLERTQTDPKSAITAWFFKIIGYDYVWRDRVSTKAFFATTTISDNCDDYVIKVLLVSIIATTISY